MKEKINIAQLLKDCPNGMELDCTMFFKPVYLKDVIIGDKYSILIEPKSGGIITLTDYGAYVDVEDAKCIIFPKGKTTWEGFQRPFKNGDIVATNNGTWIGIATRSIDREYIEVYCVIDSDDEFHAYLDEKEAWAFSRLATEDEKRKLFQAIKDNGFKWNAETKTLEKLNI